jgi:hypothetical protein
MAANASHGIDIVAPTTPESSVSRVSLPLDIPSDQPVRLLIAPLDIGRTPGSRLRRFHCRDLERQLNVDFVEEPLVVAPALWICSAVSEADSCLFASQREGRRREGDEFRQFPQILGGGG